jgi:SAM-dependent methyltransferase
VRAPAAPAIIRAVGALYDRIGQTYATSRRADPRIARQIRAAIGDARSVVNVGAGTGAYEPEGLDVVAVEPSAVMRAQREPRARTRVLAGSAEALPLADDSVDVAMAIVSDHHWADRAEGLRELRRVARTRVVLVNSEPDAARDFWLTGDYLPGFADLIPERYRDVPHAWREELRQLLGGRVTFTAVPIPHDCADGFYQAFWRRPHAYLDPTIRDNISVFRRLPPDHIDQAIERLRDDLHTGAWEQQNAALLQRAALDAGLRLVVADAD